MKFHIPKSGTLVKVADSAKVEITNHLKSMAFLSVIGLNNFVKTKELQTTEITLPTNTELTVIKLTDDFVHLVVNKSPLLDILTKRAPRKYTLVCTTNSFSKLNFTMVK